MTIDLAARYVVSDDQVCTTVGGETVILGLNDGVYYGLDAVGARVWELLSAPKSVAGLADVIVSEFDVERGRCEDDLVALLQDLVSKGLVRPASAG
jgi:hypothetical protein